MRPTCDRDRSILARLVSAVTPDSGLGALPSRSRMHSAYRSIGTSCTASFRSTTVRMIPASSPPLTHLHRAGQGPPLERGPASLQVDPASEPFDPSRYGCVHPPSHRFRHRRRNHRRSGANIWIKRSCGFRSIFAGCETLPASHGGVRVHRSRTSTAPADRTGGGGLSSSRASLPHYAGYTIAMGYSNPLSPLDWGFAPHGCRTLQ